MALSIAWSALVWVYKLDRIEMYLSGVSNNTKQKKKKEKKALTGHGIVIEYNNA